MDSQSQRMNIIYLHGFRSGPLSHKAQQLAEAVAQQPQIQLHIPDLNLAPDQVWAKLSTMMEQLSNVVLIGSSLGGFYATQLVVRYKCPAVLINPAMRPWQLFNQLFQVQLPLKVDENWTLTAQHLDDLANMAAHHVQDLDKVLVLLQQGDEVLDYREAERYYIQQHSVLIITEMGGNHAMDNFAEKIPMLLQFLSDSIA